MLYLSVVNNNNVFSEDVNEFCMLKNINIVTGKYLLSLFYYKVIIIERNIIKDARKGDSKAQYNLGHYSIFMV